jgi:hypothetical protein
MDKKGQQARALPRRFSVGRLFKNIVIHIDHYVSRVYASLRPDLAGRDVTIWPVIVDHWTIWTDDPKLFTCVSPPERLWD